MECETGRTRKIDELHKANAHARQLDHTEAAPTMEEPNILRGPAERFTASKKPVSPTSPSVPSSREADKDGIRCPNGYEDRHDHRRFHRGPTTFRLLVRTAGSVTAGRSFSTSIEEK